MFAMGGSGVTDEYPSGHQLVNAHLFLCQTGQGRTILQDFIGEKEKRMAGMSIEQ
jgi:hypothetical protein